MKIRAGDQAEQPNHYAEGLEPLAFSGSFESSRHLFVRRVARAWHGLDAWHIRGTNSFAISTP